MVLTAHDYKLVCPSYLATHRGRPCRDCAGGRFYRCLLRRCHKSSLAPSALYTAEAYLANWGRKYAVARRILCVSRFMRRELLANGFAPERLVYLPNPVDTASVTPAIGEGSHALYAGRLSHEKGLRTLLEAMQGLEIPLRIVGDGPLRAALEAEAERRGLGGRVTFAGYRSGADLSEEYRQAAFLVLPSEWFENAPMAVLEAFAHGKPVVGADIGGIPELVEPGRTGLLFPPGDAGALRRTMEDLWANRPSWGDLGSAARRRAETDFAPEHHVRALRQAYAEACR